MARLLLLLLVVGGGPALLGLVAGVAGAPRPNILHVIVDDLGWANTGYHRDVPTPEVQTPVMDALVAEGIELMRHYVHPECTPSRVSYLSGRLPMHSGQPGLCSPDSASCGLPYNVTTIAQKLLNAGYETHLVGKYDAGMATPTHTPHGRGYQTSLNYYGHGNYQWGQVEWGGSTGGKIDPPNASDPKYIRDFWDTDEPAVALSNRSRDEGIYEEALFGERMAAILDNHDRSKPLYLHYCARIAHYPIQAPRSYQQRPNIQKIDMPHRRVYHAQLEYLDEQLGNLTAKFKQLGLWNNTIMVLTADNGGYTQSMGPCSADDPVKGITCMTGEAGANNYPLLGGKYSEAEGGIRANAFVSGGFLPAAVRGTKQQEMLHIADWYATYCNLAGIDPEDKVGEAAGVPPIDSLDVWPLISGQTSVSPRAELFVTQTCYLQGDWKLLTGKIGSASWPGPEYPNASSPNNTLNRYTRNCAATPAGACLFNVGPDGDMTEHADLAAQQPERVASMKARLANWTKTVWTGKSDAAYASTCQNANAVAHEKYHGFYGPFCEIGPAPPPPGPFPPAKLTNCTWVPGMGLEPPSPFARTPVATEVACCEACGLAPTCVAAVFQCYPDRPCTCNMHTALNAQGVHPQTNSTTCITGRVPVPHAPRKPYPTSERELLN